MATKIYTFTGPVKWAHKLFTADQKFATPDKGGIFSVVMNLQGEELLRYNALGLRSKAARLDDPERKVEKGDVTFRRYEKNEKMPDKAGAPKVTGVAEGQTIGNGSVATATVEVYDYPQPDGTRGFTSRLVSIDIESLVEYIKPETTEAPF
jgi:hypothetical protein